MYTPGLKDVLRIEPVSVELWLTLLGFALSVPVVLEIHKYVKGRYVFSFMDSIKD